MIKNKNGIVKVGVHNDQERAEEKRAYWFVKSRSGKTIWPGKKYVEVKVYYDHMGRPPVKGLYWTRIYTINEYLVYQLVKDSKTSLITGQEFTGNPYYKRYMKE